MTSPDVHPVPSQGLCLQLPTNLSRRWRARNSRHPQPELEIWKEWCPYVYVQLAYSIIHTHAHANHNRHTNTSTKSAFPHFFFPCQNYHFPLESSYLQKNIPTWYSGAFILCVLLLTKSCIFQAKFLASYTTPRADQGVVYSSVPLLSLQEMPCLWKPLPELNPVNSLTIFKKSCQECHVPCI